MSLAMTAAACSANSDGLRTTQLPGSDCAGERREQELERVIPRADDKRDAEWFGINSGASGPSHERQTTTLRFHPNRHVSQGVTDVAEDKANLGRVGFDGRFAKISVEGFEEHRLAGFDVGL